MRVPSLTLTVGAKISLTLGQFSRQAFETPDTAKNCAAPRILREINARPHACREQ